MCWTGGSVNAIPWRPLDDGDRSMGFFCVLHSSCKTQLPPSAATVVWVRTMSGGLGQVFGTSRLSTTPDVTIASGVHDIVPSLSFPVMIRGFGKMIRIKHSSVSSRILLAATLYVHQSFHEEPEHEESFPAVSSVLLSHWMARRFQRINPDIRGFIPDSAEKPGFRKALVMVTNFVPREVVLRQRANFGYVELLTAVVVPVPHAASHRTSPVPAFTTQITAEGVLGALSGTRGDAGPGHSPGLAAPTGGGPAIPAQPRDTGTGGTFPSVAPPAAPPQEEDLELPDSDLALHARIRRMLN